MDFKGFHSGECVRKKGKAEMVKFIRGIAYMAGLGSLSQEEYVKIMDKVWDKAEEFFPEHLDHGCEAGRVILLTLMVMVLGERVTGNEVVEGHAPMLALAFNDAVEVIKAGVKRSSGN